MRRKRNSHTQESVLALTFGIAVVVGVLAAAVAEDLRFFATGSPESFLQTWRIQPVSMFAGSLAFVATLYLLQRLNDPPRALNYLVPYVPLVVFSGADLAIRCHPLWVGVVAVACFTGSLVQIRFWQGGRRREEWHRARSSGERGMT